MSPARRLQIKENNLALVGIAVEIAYVAGLSVFACLLCAFAYLLAG
jgi:hypothetical protein